MVLTKPKQNPIAPGIIRSNATQRKDNVVVYLAAPDGKLELAPDGRMTQKQLDNIGYKGWRRCEATGAREIEKISLILARQAADERKKLEVGKHLREWSEMEQLRARARINMAKNYSANDVEANRRTIERVDRAEKNFLKLIVSEFDPTGRTVGLDMEFSERSTSKSAGFGQKIEGIQ